jgi:hypothetical protein
MVLVAPVSIIPSSNTVSRRMMGTVATVVLMMFLCKFCRACVEEVPAAPDPLGEVEISCTIITSAATPCGGGASRFERKS